MTLSSQARNLGVIQSTLSGVPCSSSAAIRNIALRRNQTYIQASIYGGRACSFCPSLCPSDACQEVIKEQYAGGHLTATMMFLFRLSSSISSWYARGRSIPSLSLPRAVSIASCSLVIDKPRRIVEFQWLTAYMQNKTLQPRYVCNRRHSPTIEMT